MRILLATGGTGGHIFPALQTALELKKRGHEVLFAGVLGPARSKIEEAGFHCRNIPAQGFNDRSLPGMIRFGWSMAAGFVRSLGIVRAFAPQKIVGFGGYGSFPLVLAGWALRYPTMVHEQNVMPGKANRVLARLAGKVAVSFKDSTRHFGKAKTVWTGCPCHDRPSPRTREDICRSFGLDPRQRIIALLGGSQGSQRLNEVFSDAVGGMGCQAIHMTGKKEYDTYRTQYRQAKLPVVVTAFISPIEELYAAADVIVSRCGAATVSELGAFAVPSVLIPYPLADGHQKYNGRVLADAGAAVLIEQKDLNANVLVEAIGRCGELTRAGIAQKVQGLFVKDAASKLADAVEGL